MSSGNIQKVRSIFLQARDLPAARISAFLDQACPDASLRSEVESLLAADKARTLGAPRVTSAAIPTKIGPYTLLGVLGEGGMGSVYKGEQQKPILRQVAIKVVKLGMDSKAILDRFASERQALALMNHPNIAKLYDAGMTDTGQPYFAMEFVSGLPITHFADQHRMNIRQRLRLFLQVCDAIGHAHKKLIIHRDIKASNVMAYVQDGKPAIKVIDFGIAKAVTDDSSTKTLQTQAGSVVGTYEYMSPEQARGSRDIDTRTDVYSLGVLLYELLTGAPPFDSKVLGNHSDQEIRQMIQEVESPKPSTRLLALGKEGTTVSEDRQTQVNTLARQLRSELEWIPLKALAKERDRRYASPLELAEDIRNYLESRPLIAGPESQIYRVKKFISKRKVSVLATAAAVLALITGVIGTSIGFLGQRRLRLQADAQRLEADKQRNEAESQKAKVVVALDDAQTQKTKALAASDLAEKQRILAEGAATTLRQQLYVSKMIEAQRAWESGNIVTLLDCLESQRPEHTNGADLRGFEWYYWWHASHSDLMTLGGHSDRVFDARFSPDGRTIASASADKTIKVWDVASGREILTLVGHSHSVNCVCFSPDGRCLASGSMDNTIRIWDLNTGREMLTLDAHGIVKTICFSPDGKNLASGGSDQVIRIWDVAAAQLRQTLRGHESAIADVCFSSDGQRLASGSFDNTIKMWKLDTGEQIVTLSGHTSAVNNICFSPDGRELASASQDRTVRIWDLTTCKEVMTFKGHSDPVMGVCFNPDGKTLASGSCDNTIKIWDLTTGQEIQTLKGHTGWVRSVCFSPDGRKLVSASDDKTVKIWNPAVSPEALTVQVKFRAQRVCFSPDGLNLASTGAEVDNALGVYILDAEGGMVLRTFRGEPGADIANVCFSPDGRRLASGLGNGVIKIWDSVTEEQIFRFETDAGAVLDVCFSPDGKNLASSCWKGLKIWDLANGREGIALKESSGIARSICISPNGQFLASGGDDAVIRVWDLATGQKVRSLVGHTSQVHCICFSPDGHSLVSGSEDHAIKVWNLTTGQVAQTLRGHTAGVMSVRFSPDGRRLASGGLDHTTRIWDLATGQETLKFGEDVRSISSVCFSSDGRRIASGSDEGIIKIRGAADRGDVSPASQPATPLRLR